MSRQSDARRAFGRKCYNTLMARLTNQISRAEFEERLARLELELNPPQQTSFACMDCGCDPCECHEYEGDQQL